MKIKKYTGIDQMNIGNPELDDWIAFLSSNVNTNVSLTAVLFSSVMMVSVVALQLQLTGHLNIVTIIPFIIVGSVALIQFIEDQEHQGIIRKLCIELSLMN